MTRLPFIALAGLVLAASQDATQPEASVPPPQFSATPATAHVFAYVTNAGSSAVSVIETASNTVVTTVPVGDFPVRIAIISDGATFAHGSGQFF